MQHTAPPGVYHSPAARRTETDARTQRYPAPDTWTTEMYQTGSLWKWGGARWHTFFFNCLHFTSLVRSRLINKWVRCYSPVSVDPNSELQRTSNQWNRSVRKFYSIANIKKCTLRQADPIAPPTWIQIWVFIWITWNLLCFYSTTHKNSQPIKEEDQSLLSSDWPVERSPRDVNLHCFLDLKTTNICCYGSIEKCKFIILCLTLFHLRREWSSFSH